MLTIITSTFNRAHTLDRLYNSLLNQSNRSFKWIIIDDGSKDNTRGLVEEFINNSEIEIEYIYQENQGKHIGLNTAIKKVSTELALIVDSDDYLTKDAVDIIIKDWEKVRGKNICGISYLKGLNEEQVIGNKFDKDTMLDTFINMRINTNVKGDKAEVWRTDLLRKIEFPKYNNEKFLGEGYMWIKLSRHHDMLFRNKIICICEYLEGGLSKAGRTLRINSPLGGMMHAKEMLTNEFKIKIRVKNAWLYVCYGLFAKKSLHEIINSDTNKLLIIMNLPFGIILYNYWKIKYSN